MLHCLNGAITLDSATGLIYPNAEEIYSVVHEGGSSIRGESVTAADFAELQIAFSEFAAEAIVELAPAPDPSGTAIQVRLYAKEGKEMLPVELQAGAFLDYGCDGLRWIPLSPGSHLIVEGAIGKLSNSGRITLKQYLACTGKENSAISIIDRVPEMLALSGAYPAPEIPLPKTFSGTLYSYQMTGFRWLAYMASQGVPGCLLADEMGLGKTAQVICAFLACHDAGMTAPALVVAPATLLENWRREFKKFAPSILPLVHRGANRTGIAAGLYSQAVVVTSYETLLSDVSLFSGVDWGLVVLDEAQAIKNPDAKRTRTIKSIKRQAAIAVTGTPVENRLTDLWSIADFLLPDRLGTLFDFQRAFPETRDGATALEPRVTPFILRRRVAEVATDLPPRIDIPQAIELDDKSVLAYERIRATADPAARGSALAVLQKLRLFCTHPWLADESRDVTDPKLCSNKLVRVNQILEEVFGWGEKVLLFSSFHEMSDLLARTINMTFGVPVNQIDGRTPVPERQALVDRFSETQGAAALVLNPRAAGTGLNIVAANHVIHYNLEWNPAIEDQASARAFRRGQTRPVTVHRLFYSGTVEEFIDSRSTSKRDLARTSIVGSDGSDLDATDLIRH